MRWLIMVLGFLSISFGYAQVSPQNVCATAIAADGFTLMWDEVAEATGYEVELAEGYYFDFNDDLPSEWRYDNANYNISKTYAHSMSRYMALGLDSYIRSPYLESIKEISFFSRLAAENTKAEVKIQVSSDSEVWTDIAYLICDDNNHDITIDYKEHSYTIESSDVHYFKINRFNGKGSAVLIDDLQYTLNHPNETTSTSTTVIRIEDLSSNTNYTVRVKGNTSNSEFTNWLNVRTLAENSNSTGNSSLSGEPVVMRLSPDGGQVYHSVTIDPNQAGQHHYTAEVEAISTGYSYKISEQGTNGLLGAYTIEHPGFTSSDCTVEGASITNSSTGAGSSSFEITAIGKGNITITLAGGATLPVSITAFGISYASEGVCHVTWTSAAESGMLGYYVKCSADSLWENVSNVSSLIPAHNESQTQSYLYVHENPPIPGWYWLVAAFMNGEEELYGPVTQGVPYDPGHITPVYHNSVLIYPNPFGTTANMRLDLEKATLINYKVYNIKGQLLQSGVLGQFPAGSNQRLLPEFSISGKQLSNGVYLLKLEGDAVELQTRFVISK
ncbi:MAG: T9SS type A sorting domain-containing protein [Candidatus Cloacimonetes bacterium]|nr:T9SS type A sorting domain-containing protein [Candidatus Cloacimonadota bacterium]